MICQACRTANPPDARHCLQCGADLPGSDRIGDSLRRSSRQHVTPAQLSPMLTAGELLNGRYRVVRALGSGAFGRVYLGEDM